MLPFVGAACAASAVLGSIAPAQLSSAGSPKPQATFSPLSRPGGTSSLVVGGNDDCAMADVISGPGMFAVNTVGATASGPLPGCAGVQADVWFEWTATATGMATVSTCGGVAADSVIAAWSGTGCPTTVLDCNDDTCGLQSTIAFPVTNGTSYMLQFFGFGLATYSGTFTIVNAGPPSGDQCTATIPIAGAGTFPFDSTAATTGTEGQAEASCLFFGQTGISNDIWYTWTSPAGGTATVSFCGGTTMDSKIAVYDGGACPAAAALACNDDSCSLQSELSFACVAGAAYTLQVGNFPGSSAGMGTFTIAVDVPPCDVYDDGISDNSVGLTAGGDLVWLHKQGAIGQSNVVSAIRAAYGTAAFPGSAPAAGTPVTIAIWDDPNDDGNPNDLVLLATAASTVQNGDTDILNMTNLAPPVAVNGVYFIGVAITHLPGEFPASEDQNTASLGRAFVAGGGPGTVNLANLSAAGLPPTDTDLIGLPGVWLLRADCGPALGTAYCGGTTADCPCGNAGLPDHGCANSTNPDGALLGASGMATIGADTVVLQASGMTNGAGTNFCLFVQSNAQGMGVFGDGRQCLAAPFVRLGTRTIASGSASFGFGIAGDPLVSVQGAVTPGTFHYQVFYRNPAMFCTSDTFNTTNGLSIVWN
jgi:hypothetical protein